MSKTLTVKDVEKVIQAGDATNVRRPPAGPWKWPDVACVMISDSHKVEGMAGLHAQAANGDPLRLAYAVNFLERLYKLGYAVVELKTPRKGRSK
jgi:hypothetical protein